MQCPHCKGTGKIADAKPGTTNLRHGLSGRSAPEYNSWCGMRQRCNNPKDPAYPRYGGRGIKVCARWSSFENFLADVGPRPIGTTLERDDNDGNYEPGNCRWATRVEQQRNIRTNHLLEYGGVVLCVTEWAERLGLTARAITHRLAVGWTVEQAVTTPRVRGLKGGKRYAVKQGLRP